MAQEAGFPSMAVDNMSPQDTDRLTRFAQLVAEDCARVADENDFGPIPHHIGDNLRARYSLKD